MHKEASMEHKKPVIGIIPQYDYVKDTPSLYLRESYKNAVNDCGGLGILLVSPSAHSSADEHASLAPELTKQELQNVAWQVSICDGILLPGGSRIYPYDIAVCKEAMRQNKPVLGICIGMEIMALADNGNADRKAVFTEIPGGVHNQRNAKYAHDIHITRDSFLYNIVQRETMSVNSHHKNKIIALKHAQINALSDDGVIEAIHFPEYTFCLGVQFHPELLYKEDDSIRKIIEAFILAAEEHSSNSIEL